MLTDVIIITLTPEKVNLHTLLGTPRGVPTLPFSNGTCLKLHDLAFFKTKTNARMQYTDPRHLKTLSVVT